MRSDCTLCSISLSPIDPYRPFSAEVYNYTMQIHSYASAMNKSIHGKYSDFAFVSFLEMCKYSQTHPLFAQQSKPYIQTQYCTTTMPEVEISNGTIDFWCDRGGYSLYAKNVSAVRAYIAQCLSSHGIACFSVSAKDVLYIKDVQIDAEDMYFAIENMAYIVRSQAICANAVRSIVGKHTRANLITAYRTNTKDSTKRLLLALQQS